MGMDVPRQNALVEFHPVYREWLDKQDRASFSGLTLEALASKTFYFLGETPDVNGQCLVASVDTGKIHGGFYTEAFIEATS